jgi:hypothetical protein
MKPSSSSSSSFSSSFFFIDEQEDFVVGFLRFLFLLRGWNRGRNRRLGRHTERFESRRIRGRRVQRSKRRKRRERVTNQHAPREDEIGVAVLGASSVSREVVLGERRRQSRSWRTIGDDICENGEFDQRCGGVERGPESGKRGFASGVCRARSKGGYFFPAAESAAAESAEPTAESTEPTATEPAEPAEPTAAEPTTFASAAAVAAVAAAPLHSYPGCELARFR